MNIVPFPTVPEFMGWGIRMPQEGDGWRKKWPHVYWVGTFRITWGAETKLIATDHWFNPLYLSNGTRANTADGRIYKPPVKRNTWRWESDLPEEGMKVPAPPIPALVSFSSGFAPNIILSKKPVSRDKGFPEPMSCSSRPQLSLGIQGDGSKTSPSSVGIRIHGCSHPLYIIMLRSTQPRHIFLHTLKHVLTTHSPRYNVTAA